MTWLFRAAVNRRSVTILLAGALFAAGVLAWGNLKQELLPDVSFPIATVIAPYPGAAADEVAGKVVEPIERAVESLPGIDQVNSTSANSIGFIIAQFDYGSAKHITVTKGRHQTRGGDAINGRVVEAKTARPRRSCGAPSPRPTAGRTSGSSSTTGRGARSS